MNIYYFTPYSLDKNLGAAYNQYMELLPSDDDWACFLDGDTMFLTFDWGHLIQNAVESHPEAGMFTCYTNRVNNPNQCYRKYFSENRNIVAHRNIAKVCRETCKNRVKELTRSISGMMMIIQKKTWKQFPFIEGIIGVDTDISTGDAEKLDLKDNFVDYTFSFALMKHLPDSVKERVLSEFSRVSKEGIICSFALFNIPAYLLWKIKNKDPESYPIKRRTLKEIAHKNGLKVINIERLTPVIGLECVIYFDKK